MWILIKWALIDLPPWLLQALIPRGESLLAGYEMLDYTIHIDSAPTFLYFDLNNICI